MASPNNPPKTKCNKLRYKNKIQALAGLEQVKVLNVSKGQLDKNEKLHVYPCPYCKNWHVGHK